MVSFSFPKTKRNNTVGLQFDHSFLWLYTGAFSPNSAIIFYLKYPFKVFNVTFHLVLEVRKCSNFYHFLLGFQLGFHHLGYSQALNMLI